MDISILLNKTVTNLWDKTQVQQIKAIIGVSQALVGQAALPWGLRGGREPSPDLSQVGVGVTTGLPLGAAVGGRGQGPQRLFGGSSQGLQLPLRLPGAQGWEDGHSERTPPNHPLNCPKVLWAQVDLSRPTRGRRAGRASFQVRLSTRQGAGFRVKDHEGRPCAWPRAGSRALRHPSEKPRGDKSL